MESQKKVLDIVIKPSIVLAFKEGLIFSCCLILFLIMNFATPDFLFTLPIKILIVITYLLLALSLISFIVFIYKVLKLKTTSFTISDEQIFYKFGILTVNREYMEIYRIKDFSIYSPFFLRIFSLSNLTIHSSDKTHPILILKGVSNIDVIYSTLRERVEIMRRIKGVREFDSMS